MFNLVCNSIQSGYSSTLSAYDYAFGEKYLTGDLSKDIQLLGQKERHGHVVTKEIFQKAKSSLPQLEIVKNVQAVYGGAKASLITGLVTAASKAIYTQLYNGGEGFMDYSPLLFVSALVAFVWQKDRTYQRLNDSDKAKAKSFKESLAKEYDAIGRQLKIDYLKAYSSGDEAGKMRCLEEAENIIINKDVIKRKLEKISLVGSMFADSIQGLLIRII